MVRIRDQEPRRQFKKIDVLCRITVATMEAPRSPSRLLLLVRDRRLILLVVGVAGLQEVRGAHLLRGHDA